ncbi:hypothetical protein EDC56_0936 [Sinobacterium caligoides]|uniref:Uncharacterized protein n=1 Tax=Sinobacterium caligoides TaxID=933926 RepID=A0A3N2DZX3_9GAMM|nr:hypothetical protein [Sinobacterium caligoides]ROS05406.1 hypothetical protein EDC56_0936 [Sinobacterium caligoides]
MKKIGLLFVVSMLSACGGGGSSDNDAVAAESSASTAGSEQTKTEEGAVGKVYTPFEGGYSLDSRDAIDSSQDITGVWLLAGEKKKFNSEGEYKSNRLFYYQLATIEKEDSGYVLSTCDFYGDKHTSIPFSLENNQYKVADKDDYNWITTNELSFAENKLSWLTDEKQSDGSPSFSQEKEGYKIAETANSLELGKLAIRYITEAGTALLPENSEYDIACFHIVQGTDNGENVAEANAIELGVVAENSAGGSPIEISFDGTVTASSGDGDSAHVSVGGVKTDKLFYSSNDFQADFSSSIDSEEAGYSITVTDTAGRGDTASIEVQLSLP